MSRLEQRIKEFGLVGAKLNSIAARYRVEPCEYGDLNLVAGLVKLKSREVAYGKLHPLLASAVSLLYLEYPLQLALSASDLRCMLVEVMGVDAALLNKAVPGPYFLNNGVNDFEGVQGYLHGLMFNSNFLSAAFPVKVHPGATNKVNIVLSRLLQSLVRGGYRDTVERMICVHAGYLTEDQFMNCLLFGLGLQPTFGSLGWAVASEYLRRPKDAKNLSTVIKALGGNTTRAGALLVEGDTLQGRAPAPFDLTGDARYRVSADGVSGKVLELGEAIRPHIRAILARELSADNTELPELHTWWSQRWGWCVNGSQTAISARSLGVDPSTFDRTHTRMYRRMIAENVEHEPLTAWDGRSTVSMSEKLENGKTRAIYSCDTMNYFAFSWIIGAAEKAWNNERVLLNPGLNGQVGVVRRVRHAQKGGGVNLMLDYDDFNSHHATSTMQTLFDELCDAFSAPAWYKNVLHKSFDNMYLKVDGEYQRVLGTMMSGHRGTAFINSILNAAYIRMAVGAEYFDKLLSLHVGDDVYIRCNTLNDCERILKGTRALGCRMNPTKQSIGYTGAEFLRVGIGAHAAYGYYARGVSSFVGGNWLSEKILDPIEGLQHGISGCRTLMNRSGNFNLAKLVAPAVRYVRGLPVPTVVKLLSGELVIEGAPVYNCDGYLRTTTVKPEPAARIEIDSAWKHHATNDYLSMHTSDVERAALDMATVNATNLLIVPSYQKGLDIPIKLFTANLRLTRPKIRVARGFAMLDDVLKENNEIGVLNKYPIIQFVKNSLTEDHLVELLAMEGVSVQPQDARLYAFGPDSTTKNIIGFLSYSDAASLTKKARVDNIICLFHVYL